MAMGLKVEDISAHKNAHYQRIGWRHETLWGLKFLWILVENKKMWKNSWFPESRNMIYVHGGFSTIYMFNSG